MNRYPLWKYILIVIALVAGVLYMMPNFFGESPALQISSSKATVKVDPGVITLAEEVLAKHNIKPLGSVFDTVGTQNSVRLRFANTDIQFRAKSLLEQELNKDPSDPTYLVAFNLLPNTPNWLQSIRAKPMNLGLDLRGGVHFLMQVDTQAVINKRLLGFQSSVRNLLFEKKEVVRYTSLVRNGKVIEITFKDSDALGKARNIIAGQIPELVLQDGVAGSEVKLIATVPDAVLKQAIENAVQQNISTLSKRVNEFGVAEPLIQRQGADRIVIQLPGVQDVVGARTLLGRTATLEVRLVDETVARGSETPGIDSELFKVGRGAPVVLYKDVIITGEYISNASPTIDSTTGAPAVHLDLNGDGGRRMRKATENKIGKLMAVVLFEKNKGEVLTVATIQQELGSQFQITQMGSIEAATDLAMLLRAGSLAAPMEIIEERTIGPQLGVENIAKGFNSVLYGFAAIAIFMVIYYHLFGFFSVFGLAVNLMLLIAVLSGLGATLTLPGMAAIAFTLGMAIDANVLINERIREELRAGHAPQQAIAAGFDRAWATILDSNVTTLIAGLALLVFGSGPVRGFAVVHCLGILTSIFSAVFVSRGIINFWYGRKKKLTGISIGQIWKPAT